MTIKRNKAVPPIKLTFWKKEGKLWYAERVDLEKAISCCGLSETDLRAKLGAGYQSLEEALAGKRLDGWTVSHLEWGLTPEDKNAVKQPAHSWPPPNYRS